MKRGHRILLIIILIVVAGNILLLQDQIDTNMLLSHSDQFQQSITQHYWIAAAVFLIGCVLTAALSIPLLNPLTVIAGFFFGVLLGSALMITGTAIGAWCGAWSIRYCVGTVTKTPLIARLQHELQTHGTLYLLSLRLIPLVPSLVQNTLVAISKIPLLTFAVITAVGMLPMTLFGTTLGKQLAHAQSDDLTISLTSILFLSLLALLPLLMIGARKILHRRDNS